MLVEAITTATFSNGILRLEVATINGRGEQVVSGNIEIPGIRYLMYLHQFLRLHKIYLNSCHRMISQMEEIIRALHRVKK